MKLAHTPASSGVPYEDWCLAPTADTARRPDLTSCARLTRAIVAVRRPSILLDCVWMKLDDEL